MAPGAGARSRAYRVYGFRGLYYVALVHCSILVRSYTERESRFNGCECRRMGTWMDSSSWRYRDTSRITCNPAPISCAPAWGRKSTPKATPFLKFTPGLLMLLTVEEGVVISSYY